jgi:predicted peptidase
MKAKKNVIDFIKQIGFKEISFSAAKKSLFDSRLCLFAITLILLISSCTDSDSIDVVPTSQNPTIAYPPILTIDSTDLKDLPVDIGGTHTAYPLDSTDAVFGHFVYTPGGYTEDGSEYPLLVFLHGWDPTMYTGTDEAELNELLTGRTPPGLIQSGRWKPSFPFIVASPRLKSHWYWRHDDIHDFIKYMINEYKVNTKRIYLTGLSLGGGGAWYYVGERGEDNYVAAIVPISARGEERIVSNLTKIPIWAFHGDSDTTVPPYENFGSVKLVAAINANNPEIKARVTVFNNTGHDAWSRVYSDHFTTAAQGTPFNLPICDWLLQYKKE